MKNKKFAQAKKYPKDFKFEDIKQDLLKWDQGFKDLVTKLKREKDNEETEEEVKETD